MNFSFYFFGGLFHTALLFFLCFICVVGFRFTLRAIVSKFAPPQQEQPKKRPRKPKKQPAEQVKPIRSIEIDPDQIDKIFVKKSS
ncbi:MAG: hypothetical protein IJV99_00425 [Clostridia bacterium]|nr:hypothetical protein [Clostridia bacterium]